MTQYKNTSLPMIAAMMPTMAVPKISPMTTDSTYERA